MKYITVRIQGTTPLICNKFTDAAQAAASNGTRGSAVGNRGTPQEIAESKIYRDTEGTICIPSPNIFRAIIDAGKFFKNGKSKVTTIKSSAIPACVRMDSATVTLEHVQDWKVDSRPVRIPTTGGRILCHRPMFDDWALEFELSLDDSIMSPKFLREIIDAAGSRIGLGDFRPDCKGMFGAFVVTSWVVRDEVASDGETAKAAAVA